MTRPPNPLRIKRLTLTDFRAFPGPAPVHFDLDSKNMLVYGENGAGKSSIFYALSEFFSLKPSRSLRGLKNVFSGESETGCAVNIEFNDGAPEASWCLQVGSGVLGAAPLGSHSIGGAASIRERHPAAVSGGNDPRVIQTALRRACLDYRALLDTNYKHGDGAVNLFEIAVEKLLGDFLVPVSGGQSRTIRELWAAVESATRGQPSAPKSGSAPSTAYQRALSACSEFNSGLNQALAALLPFVGTLLGELIGSDVTVATFVFGGVTYTAAHYKRDRTIAGRLLTLDVSYRTHQLTVPQHFLNEARLSALALAIYLAGRLACTPTATPNALKLLVLDDVLIGLDHSNRLPVLDVLRTHFADWQVLLLTHDRVWFEMARFHLGNTGHWKCLEVFEGADVVRNIPAPTVRAPGDKAAKACLDQARDFLDSHYIPAAANYTRSAFELALKSFCERFGVPVVFKSDPRHVDTEKLLAAIEGWLKGHTAKGCLAGVIERVKLFRKVVLNPYSHAAPPNIARAEVDGAILAVEKLLAVVERSTDGDPLQAAQELIGAAQATSEQLHAALGYLRAAFHVGLRQFCNRKHVSIIFKERGEDAQSLWSAVFSQRAVLFSPPHQQLPVQIEAERGWLISPVAEADLARLAHADLVRIIGLLVPAGGAGMVLDML
ncbi:AAA family ATPase [Pseudogulbenkiania sp. MAI-1]|uniref:AAA family ATPase n=1 Tax=Pseudogulbenkiania sp. MAI-1 TaxID=990370 RepID=UPI0004B89178|nr:ATP-binding protein [Pseudogulbenkiania sp. MAI-1]